MALSPALSFGVTVWGGRPLHNARYPTYSSTGLHRGKLLGCYRGGLGSVYSYLGWLLAAKSLEEVGVMIQKCLLLGVQPLDR